jgi:hypothetical protein
VQFHTAGVITLAVLGSLPACRKPSATAPSVSSPSTSLRLEVQDKVDTAPKAEVKIAPADPLCHSRPRCSVTDRLPAGNTDAGQVLVVRLAAAAGAADDEARCDRREYWLSRAGGDLLLAMDCEEQWGAESAGPASISVSGTLATFHCVEFLADDACEIVDAALRLPQGRIESHTRHLGKVVVNACRPSRKNAPIPAPGSGKLDDPILVLQRP